MDSQNSMGEITSAQVPLPHTKASSPLFTTSEGVLEENNELLLSGKRSVPGNSTVRKLLPKADGRWTKKENELFLEGKLRYYY